MRATVLILLAGICLATTLNAANEAEATFARANADYAAGKYANAINGYETLVKNGQWNASVFYDLGNACFRTGDLGRAILNYERALALDPAQPEARANLQLVRDRARALELGTTWAEQHLDFLTRDQYTWLAAIAFWGAVAIGMGLNFSKRRPAAEVISRLWSTRTSPRVSPRRRVPEPFSFCPPGVRSRFSALAEIGITPPCLTTSEAGSQTAARNASVSSSGGAPAV